MAQIPVRGSHRASCALSVWHALLVTDILPDQEPIRLQFSAEAIWFAVGLICVLLAWDVMSVANQGSQQASSVAVRHAGSTIKVQFGKPFWPTTKLVESLLELAQLDLGAWTGWCRASVYCAAFKHVVGCSSALVGSRAVAPYYGQGGGQDSGRDVVAKARHVVKKTIFWGLKRDTKQSGQNLWAERCGDI